MGKGDDCAVTVAEVCAAGMERRAALMALGEEARFAGRARAEGRGRAAGMERGRGVAGARERGRERGQRGRVCWRDSAQIAGLATDNKEWVFERGERATAYGRTMHQKNVDAYTNVLSGSRD